jgi:hypothetical protein
MGIGVIFLDSGREPTRRPNPAYPDGIDVDLRQHALEAACCYNVPYPAPRCGAYHVKCEKCGYVAVITVAGRPDDPRTITMPCKPSGSA